MCKLDLCGGHTLFLHEILFSPEIRRNLVSIASLVGLGYILHFKRSGFFIKYGTVYYGCGHIIDGFSVLDVEHRIYNCFSLTSSCNTSNDDLNVWHARLGHIGKYRMERLALTKINLPICEPCLAGKATRKQFGKRKRVDYPLQLIPSNICGPINVRARHGASYFITVIDDFTLQQIDNLATENYVGNIKNSVGN